jgi:DNA-binding transcriptional ArsR family regulator
VRDAAPLFAALGDPTRLGLVAHLSARGPGSIAALSESVDVSRQAVAKHLHVLSEAGLVRGFRSGRQHIFELEPGRFAKARDYLSSIDAQWDAALERLEAFLEDQ